MSNESPAVYDLISLREASVLVGLSAVHLRHLVDKQIIWGKKIGRNWVTSKQEILEYSKKTHKPGRKVKVI